MPCHWICKRDWFEIGECVRWGLFIFLALRPFVVKHVFIFSNHFHFFLLKVFRISCFICFFFLLKGTLLTLIPTAMLRKGLIRRGVCLFFTIGHYRKLIYFFCQGPQQCLQNVKRNMAHHFGGESTCLKHTNITVQYEFYTLPGCVFSVHVTL